MYYGKSMKRILVTGATGFVGNSLVDKLIECDNEVIPIGRSMKPWTSKFVKENLLKIDLIKDELPNLGVIDCVCILGALQPLGNNDWENYYQINSNQIFKFFSSKINQIIYVSTTSVNLVNGIPDPLNYYGLSKALGESLLKINKYRFNQTTILRFPSIIGVNHHGGIIHDLRIMAKNNDEIVLYDKGRKYRNIIYIDFVIDQIINIVNSSKRLSNCEIFNIGSKESNTLSAIADMLVKNMKSKSEIKLSKKVTLSNDVYVDNTIAISKLLYNPPTIEDCIKLYLKDYNYKV